MAKTEKQCPNPKCKKGIVTWRIRSDTGDVDVVTRKCQTCGGKGKVPA